MTKVIVLSLSIALLYFKLKYKAMSKPKFKQYDRVSPIETSNIITTVNGVVTYRRGLKRERYYRLTNGQFLAEDELQKAES